MAFSTWHWDHFLKDPLNQKANRKGPPRDVTRTIRIDVQYEGTKYVGWQRQAKGKSIQGVLEQALAKVAAEKITLYSSSRTDAGVHAREQVASFSLKKSRTPVRAFVEGTNSLLPDDIRVFDAKEMNLGFHANFDAVEKTYRYFFQPGQIPSVFFRAYAWHFRQKLNLTAMKKGADFLLGEHDFAAFRTQGSQTKTTVRKVFEATWTHAPMNLLYFEISANGFLKYMVRNVVGTLVDVGLGKKKPEDVRKVLESGKRERGGKTAPPHGLFLWRVKYE